MSLISSILKALLTMSLQPLFAIDRRTTMSTHNEYNENEERCKTCAEIREEQDECLRRECEQKVNHLPRTNCECPDCDAQPEGDCRCECEPVCLPKLEPCISIKWGHGKCDDFESDGIEVLCITVCNCYSNVTFKDFSIGRIKITDKDGRPVPCLPNGTPSVQVIPSGPICFGDIKPCREKTPCCVSREFVIVTCGAIGQCYVLSLEGVCFTVSYESQSKQCFIVKLCCD